MPHRNKTHISRHAKSLGLFVSFTIIQCGRPSHSNRCLPGVTTECACTNRTQGTQTCLSAGSFGSCLCTPSVSPEPLQRTAAPLRRIESMDVNAVVNRLDAENRRAVAADEIETNRIWAATGRSDWSSFYVECRNAWTQQRHLEILSLTSTLTSAIAVLNAGGQSAEACRLLSSIRHAVANITAAEHRENAHPDIPCRLPPLTIPSSIENMTTNLTQRCSEGRER